MSFRKHIVTAIIAVGIACPTIAKAENHLEAIKAAGVIKIGMDVAVKPFAFKDEEGKLVGSDPLVAEALAKDLGVKLEIVPVSSANRIPYLVTNKVDITISTLGITEERRKTIDFTIPYSVGLNGLSAPAATNIKSYADLAGMKVGVTRGTTYDKKLTENVPSGTEIVRFADEATTLTAVATGQVDAVGQALSILPELQKRAPGQNFEAKFTIEESLFGIGVRKNEPELLSYLNAWAIDGLESGRLNEFYTKYQGRGLSESVLKAAK